MYRLLLKVTIAILTDGLQATLQRPGAVTDQLHQMQNKGVEIFLLKFLSRGVVEKTIHGSLDVA